MCSLQTMVLGCTLLIQAAVVENGLLWAEQAGGWARLAGPTCWLFRGAVCDTDGESRVARGKNHLAGRAQLSR